MTLGQYYQRIKNAIHGLQALLIFTGAIITLAIFTKGGQGDGRVNYYFVLCLLSIPALIYQTAVPSFERTKRFANPYAHAAIDLVFTIFWFAAFVGMFVWVHQGSHKAKDWKDGDSSCELFAWGPTSKCKLGRGTGGLGVMIWLVFAITTGFSVYGISHFRTHGYLPTSTPRTAQPIPSDEVDDAFSAAPYDKIHQHDEEEMQELSSGTHARNQDEVLPLPLSHNNDNPPELPPHTLTPKSSTSSWGRHSPISPLDHGVERGDSTTTYHGWMQNYYPQSKQNPTPPPQRFAEETAYNRSNSGAYDPPRPKPTTPSQHFTTEASYNRSNSGAYDPPSIHPTPPPPQFDADTSYSNRASSGYTNATGRKAVDTGASSAGGGGAGGERIDFPDGDYGR